MKQNELKKIIIQLVEVIKDVPFQEWDKIKYTIDSLYLCNNLKNTLNGNKDTLKIIDRCI